MNCSQKKIVRSSNKEITMAQMKKPAMKKPTVSRAPSKTPKTPMPKIGKKPAPLTGPAAVEALQKRVSPSGVKKAEAGAKKAIDKKYPGLYKATKEVTGKVNKSMDNKPMSPAEKAKAKKILEKIKADSKRKAKTETQKRKAPDSNFIARM
jgi:hypothetical protein